MLSSLFQLPVTEYHKKIQEYFLKLQRYYSSLTIRHDVHLDRANHVKDHRPCKFSQQTVQQSTDRVWIWDFKMTSQSFWLQVSTTELPIFLVHLEFRYHSIHPFMFVPFVSF